MTGPRETSSTDTPCIQLPANDDCVPSGFIARFLCLWVVLVPTALLFCGAVYRIWVAEDGFITFRSVENLWQGNGPVYNRGIRVESFSHPLWFLTLSALRIFGSSNLPPLSALVGIICSIFGLGFAARAAWLRCETGLRLFPLGALAIACIPPFWDFASSGLETGMTFLWIGWCSYALTRCVGVRGMVMKTALSIGLGPLIRPDLLVITLCLLFVLLTTPGMRRSTRLATLLVGILPGALWQVFRMGYYAALIPTTFIAKESFGSVWWRGYLYLEDFLLTYNPELVLFLGACALAGRSPRFARRGGGIKEAITKVWHDNVIAALCVGGALHILSVCRVGGDFMHARLLLPGVFAILSSFAVISLPRARVPRVFMAIGCLVWCAWTSVYARTPYALHLSSTGIANERLWHVLRAEKDRPVSIHGYQRHFFVGIAKDLQRRAGQDGTRAVFVPNIGIPPSLLSTDEVVIDSLGLNDYIGARLRLEGHGRAGHEKGVPAAWFLARYPAPYGYISPIQVSRVSAKFPSAEAVGAARRVLESAELVELRDAVTEPMTLSRFVRNLVLSWRLTFLRVPSDPEAAERELRG